MIKNKSTKTALIAIGLLWMGLAQAQDLSTLRAEMPWETAEVLLTV